MIDLSTSLADALSDIVNRIQRSLAVLHNGKHGIGAGLIWRQDGLVLTNYHVIAHGHNRVALANGEEYATRLVAQDPEIDLALLEIDAKDLLRELFDQIFHYLSSSDSSVSSKSNFARLQ